MVASLPVIGSSPDSETGLYISTDTNSGKPTYYFRGNVDNNYVSFAGFTWRIVRINEDNTIRMIMEEGINNNTTYSFILYNTGTDSKYYSNSNAKRYIDDWYKRYIVERGYESRVVDGNYFCQEAKNFKTSMYELSFKCATDENGYGILKSNIGLLSLDEAIYAGYRFVASPIHGPTYNGTTDNYLSSQNISWLISTGGFSIQTTIYSSSTNNSYALRPVINLNSNVKVTGSGTSSNPYVIQ